MIDFNSELQRQLDEIRAQGLYRELRRVDSPQSPQTEIAGRTFLNFSSNDYLGLANHPALKQAAIYAIEKFGAGSGASRLICGSLAPHHELEIALAQFKQTESALSFSTGYAAALGAICALVGREDIIVLDKLVHACIVDAARLSGAKLRIFAHNDLASLEEILQWSAAQTNQTSPRRPRILVVTESVFSMDGDLAPLREIVELKEKYGAWLMLDEAHATGLFGRQRRGLVEQLGLSGRVEIQMGTLGKALGASGGYIAGSHVLTELLINRARTFIFSTAPAPAAAAAAREAIQLVQSAEGQERCEHLWKLIHLAKTRLAEANWPVNAIGSAILPLIIGGESKAIDTAAALREKGIYIPAIRYPTVSRGAARLRLTLSAAHTTENVNTVLDALNATVKNPANPTSAHA